MESSTLREAGRRRQWELEKATRKGNISEDLMMYQSFLRRYKGERRVVESSWAKAEATEYVQAMGSDAGVSGDKHGNVGKRRLVFFQFCIENLTLN